MSAALTNCLKLWIKATCLFKQNPFWETKSTTSILLREMTNSTTNMASYRDRKEAIIFDENHKMLLLIRWKVTHFDVLNKINVSFFSRLCVVFLSSDNGPFWWLLRRRSLWSFLLCEFFEHLWTQSAETYLGVIYNVRWHCFESRSLSTIELCCDANTNLKRLRSWKKKEIGRHPDSFTNHK